jgi:hypothetical protein
MKVVRACALGLLLAVLGYAAFPASADVSNSPFLLMRDLQIGMEGFGKTTTGGDRVRLFQVRIVGIIDNPGDLNDFILVRASGDLIREAGGYAQGMSGSPIYINNRLIGAFFAAFLYDESPNPIGLVRPIETMLKLIEPIQKTIEAQSPVSSLPTRADKELLPLEQAIEDVRFEDGTMRRVEFVSRPPSERERRAHPDTLYAVRTGTPLWVSGLTGRALDWFKTGVDATVFERYASGLLPISPSMRPQGLRDFMEELQTGFEERFGSSIYPFAATAAQFGEFDEEFEPGRPMAALLTNGDVTLGGVCTTSYIDSEAGVLLACGHQLFLTGDSGLFLAKARVIDTVNSGPISFVLPQVDRFEILGTILQDRMQAIGAAIDRLPKSVRLTARIQDVTTGAVQDLTINLADTSTFVPFLVFASLLQGVDVTLNRIGKGTMRVEYTIRGANMPKRLERSDVFTSFNDVALFGPLQVAQVVFLLEQNEFADPEIERIDVDILITEPVKLLQIESIETDKEVYRPGDTIEYTIALRPYRGVTKEVRGSLKLPEDLTARRLTLHVFGGPRRQQNSAQSQTVQYGDITQLIEAVENSTTNDQLTVELLGLPRSNDEGAGKGNDSDFQHVRKLGDWVVTGEGRVTLQIEKPKPEEPEPTQEKSPAEENGPESDSNPQNGETDDSQGEPKDGNCDQPFYC